MSINRKPGERTVTVSAVRIDLSGMEKRVQRDLFSRNEVLRLLAVSPATLSRRISLLRQLSPEFANEFHRGSDQYSLYAIWILVWAQSFIEAFPGLTTRSKVAGLRKHLIESGLPNHEFNEWKSRWQEISETLEASCQTHK